MNALTKKEQAWVARVQKALDACPSKDKIGFYTTGDSGINLYDLRRVDDVFELQNEGRDFGPACNTLGIEFEEDLKFPSPVESTAG